MIVCAVTQPCIFGVGRYFFLIFFFLSKFPGQNIRKIGNANKIFGVRHDFCGSEGAADKQLFLFCLTRAKMEKNLWLQLKILS
jgi:hypothetical protein